MWASAALGNIMADFSSVSARSSNNVRKHILKTKGLVKEFAKLASFGPVRKGTSKATWPGEATASIRRSKRLVAWGALHALNNCALLKASHSRMRLAGVVEIAKKHLSSPDWLEAMKSELVLLNLRENHA